MAKATMADATDTGEPGDAPLIDLNEGTLKKLVARAKKRGYITVDQLNEMLPQDQMSSEQIEDVMSALNDMGINVVENEEGGEDGETDLAINATMAQRAVRAFPMLAAARVVRSWSGLRVMTTDGFPIYDQSRQHPGAFIATCHSGVTLAANHAGLVADAIAAGRLPDALTPFSARRFNVHAAG